MNDSSQPAELQSGDDLRAQVLERYGSLARSVIESAESGSCCGPDAESPRANPISSELYGDDESSEVPDAAMDASLGCGNPTALIDMHEGQVVLDLGSGGGIDVLLSARRVGSSGYVYGLDMTDDMLELARQNQRDAGVDNVEFLKGTIEDIPLPDAAVDLIISNCVINLSVDKEKVFREASRVLRPGGRFAVSDIVIRGSLDPEIRRNVEAWIGCVAGALEEDEYRTGLERAGFTDVEIEATRIFDAADAREFLEAQSLSDDAIRTAEGHVISAFVRATKP